MKLYQIHASANCYRVRLMLGLLGLEAEWIEVDHKGGELETASFRALNPFGEVPVLEDGDVRLRDSQAILVYLARRYGAAHWLPLDAGDLGRVQQWLSFAANEIQNGPRVARGIVLFGRTGDFEDALRKARRALGLLNVHLSDRDWIETGFPTVADIACYPYVSRASDAGIDMLLWVQHLRTGQIDSVALGRAGAEEERLEDYFVAGLVDFDDVSYDDHAELLYDLAGQTVQHFRAYLSEDDARKVLRCYQKPIAQLIHAQMQQHFWEKAEGYDVVVTRGFTELKASAYSASGSEPPLDFRQPPADKSNMGKYLFGGFERCLYDVQKFDSDTERQLAVILDREAEKWCRPAKGQFRINYKLGGLQPEYQPDFVAETKSTIFMIESKAQNQLQSAEVLAKKEVGKTWCQHATNHSSKNGGKPWRYMLIPHMIVAANMTIEGLAAHAIE